MKIWMWVYMILRRPLIMYEISSPEMENFETIPKTCKGLFTPNESGSEREKDQRNEKYQSLYKE